MTKRFFQPSFLSQVRSGDVRIFFIINLRYLAIDEIVVEIDLFMIQSNSLSVLCRINVFM